jgi:hypothetical protein
MQVGSDFLSFASSTRPSKVLPAGIACGDGRVLRLAANERKQFEIHQHGPYPRKAAEPASPERLTTVRAMRAAPYRTS